MKTTKQQFLIFKNECERLIERFGLSGWRVEFYWSSESDDSRASIGTNLSGRATSLYFPRNWEDSTPPSKKIIIESARHEICHLISARLSSLARQRFTSEDEVYESNEELARIMDFAIRKGY